MAPPDPKNAFLIKRLKIGEKHSPPSDFSFAAFWQKKDPGIEILDQFLHLQEIYLQFHRIFAFFLVKSMNMGFYPFA